MDDATTTIDRAIRMELTHAIDNYDVSFAHEDFDVAYTIPPLGWSDDREYERIEILSDDVVDTDARVVRYSTPPVVWGMIQAAIEDGYAESATDFVRKAVARQLGLVES